MSPLEGSFRPVKVERHLSSPSRRKRYWSLLTFIFNKKAKWDFQIDHKFEIFEQMGNLCQIQNGINKISYAFDTLQSLFMYLGSQGCLLSRAYPYEITKILKICRIISLWGRISFSIYCIALWSLLSLPGLYQGHGGGSKISPNGRNLRGSILRRLPTNRRFRKDGKSSWENQEIREEEVCVSKDSYESSGDHDIMHPECGLVPKSLKNIAVMDSCRMGQKPSSSSFAIDNPLKSEGITKMMEESQESAERGKLGPMALLPGKYVQGYWTQEIAQTSSNERELRAVLNTLKSCANELKGHHVKVVSDNTTTVAYLRRQGGTRSKRLLKISQQIFFWAEENIQSISAIHLRGSQNIVADYFSRSQILPHEWSLSQLH
ncbi:uncharacterized protein [Engystomops pustulosus]|uniref:uncharacterized protein n=1 Tax=Engystomops pustulosus TaxID=76066 RepID=UPI003AFAA304